MHSAKEAGRISASDDDKGASRPGAVHQPSHAVTDQ